MLAREYCAATKRKFKPVILSHGMLPGLLQVRHATHTFVNCCLLPSSAMEHCSSAVAACIGSRRHRRPVQLCFADVVPDCWAPCVSLVVMWMHACKARVQGDPWYNMKFWQRVCAPWRSRARQRCPKATPVSPWG